MRKLLFLITAALMAGQLSYSQIPLDNLKAFTVGKNWQIVADVSADLENETFEVEKGTGVLVNLPEKGKVSNLLTKAEYGDVDIELDFMMAPHSNSGIYLMGRYEVQLLDSWGKLNPTYGDVGGIYQRRRSDGSQFEGHAPRINAAKAPGTWQKMYISFQAPRFNKDGQKIQNAKILKVVLNGFTVQENIELTGPTGGPISQEEAKRGPIMIQGDHGPVAFRNVYIREFSNPEFTLSDLKRTIYKGDIQPLLRYDWDGMESTTHPVENLSVLDIDDELGWASLFKGKIMIPSDGIYTFSLQAGGESNLLIDGKIAVEKDWMRTNWDPRQGNPLTLTKGLHEFELTYSKVDGWLQTGLGVFVESENIRRKPLHDKSALVAVGGGQGPVIVEANEARVMRSFISLPVENGDHVYTHVVNVGSPTGLHYSYDTSTGRLLRIWRGGFLDASPMWNGRGNAQSLPLGPQLVLNSDYSLNPSYKAKGYDIKRDGYPIFRYLLDNNLVQDEVVSDGKTISRTISGEGLDGVRIVILRANQIQESRDGRFSINDKEFYIQSDSDLTISNKDGQAELSAVISSGKLNYTIIW